MSKHTKSCPREASILWGEAGKKQIHPEHNAQGIRAKKENGGGRIGGEEPESQSQSLSAEGSGPPKGSEGGATRLSG